MFAQDCKNQNYKCLHNIIKPHIINAAIVKNRMWLEGAFYLDHGPLTGIATIAFAFRIE